MSSPTDDMLRAVIEHDGSTINELARQLGMHPEVVHGLLLILQRRGAVHSIQARRDDLRWHVVQATEPFR